ncbi:antirepressor [Thermoanaerobacter sp. YS13]|uniref:phage antirepressor KilAC domain-containing protein n=1 Tax=Thermoanaerobacter sp. YS13 TaxID=1511746 RepID=UPI0005735840|nr:phage antirepressor KilAC domain-containing protein [Thermoanaerobacter sp. YS13]KHO63392.1 antirepressor [Thermoanaerobacter sp. YS13]
MNEIQIFNSKDFGKLRVLAKSSDEIYFNLFDVAWALGYTRSNAIGQMYLYKNRIINIIESLDISVVNTTFTQIKISSDFDFEQLYITESGLYDLILESKAKHARNFRKWVVSEVLPTIRRTGGYVANEDLFIETYLPYADEATKALFKSALQTIREQNEKIKVMQPKAEYFDALVERNLLTNFRDTAKELGIKERTFINWLIRKKFIYRDQKGDLRPYAPYNKTLFEIKEWTRNEIAGVQTLITPKGRETFRLLLQKDNLI